MRDLLRNRSFTRVWLAQFVSGLGDKAAVLAFFALVLDRTGDVADLGLLAAAQVLPGILLGPWAGVLADRWSRRGVMIAADLLGAAVCLALPLIWDHLGVVYAAAALLSVGRQVAGPARLAIMPDLVPSSLLNKTNALAMLSQNLVLLLGMAAGGLVVHHLGAAAAFRWDAVTFLVSASLLGLRKLRYLTSQRSTETEDSAPEPARARWTEALQGARWIWARPRLRFAVGFLGVVTMVTAMQPPLVFDFVRSTLGRSESQLGLIFGAAGLGGLAGAVIAGLLREKAEPLRVVTWLIALDGVFLLLFAVNHHIGLAVVLFLLFGALSTGVQVNLATFLQRETPAERRGRIFGWLSPMLGPLSLVSVLVGPLLASAVGAATVLFGAGVVEMIAGLGGRLALGKRQDPDTGMTPDNSVSRAMKEEA